MCEVVLLMLSCLRKDAVCWCCYDVGVVKVGKVMLLLQGNHSFSYKICSYFSCYCCCYWVCVKGACIVVVVDVGVM